MFPYLRAFFVLLAAVGVIAGLGACARPHVQPGGDVRALPVLHETHAIMDDGYRLPLQRWTATGECRAQLLALHGLNDYRRAFTGLGEYLARRGVNVLAYDQRGFGDAAGFGLWHGSGRLVDDLRLMVTLVKAARPGCPLYVLGESMGGAVALVALDSIGGDIAGMVLVAPAVWSRDTMPFYQRVALWLAVHTMPARRLTGEGLDIRPSDNVAMLRALGRDPRVIKATRVDVLYGVSNLMDQAALATPREDAALLFLYGMHDDIIPRKPTCRLLTQWAQARPRWRVVLYENGYHMLTRDLQAARVMADIHHWLEGGGRLARETDRTLTAFCQS